MQISLIESPESSRWRSALNVFKRVDVCQLPEYHTAYSARVAGAKALLWHFENEGERLCYPFLIAPVGLETNYNDISSIYGYSGPLSTTENREFLNRAWNTFDDWCHNNNVIAEFTRFSLFARTQNFAHPDTLVEENRHCAISWLPETREAFLSALGKKTRNMIRKAEQSGLEGREIEPCHGIDEFRKLYEETMIRNAAPDFFIYDDLYYERLLSLPPGELRLFGVFDKNKMVAAAIALSYEEGALYHLGASLEEYSKSGAGNLGLFHMSIGLMSQGVKFITIGGGRTTSEDDPLLRFKKSNATNMDAYYIGRRIVNKRAYSEVVEKWENIHETKADLKKLQFYRRA